MLMAAAGERQVRTFGEALLILRVKAGLSYHQVGSHIGVDKDTVREWERGSLTPSPLFLKRLYDLLPRLRYFTSFLPKVLRDQLASRAYAAGAEKHLWVPPSPTPADLPIPEDLVDIHFGESLRTAMCDESITEDDLSSVLSVDVATILKWQSDTEVPNDDQYKTLLDLFPQLANSPKPGASGYVMPPLLDGPVARIIPLHGPSAEDEEEETTVFNRPSPVIPEPKIQAPKPAPPPPPPVVKAQPAPLQPHKRVRSKVDMAGVEHANALLALQHAKVHLEELKGQVKLVEQEMESLIQAAKESEKNLLDAVYAAAEEMS